MKHLFQVLLSRKNRVFLFFFPALALFIGLIIQITAIVAYAEDTSASMQRSPSYQVQPAAAQEQAAPSRAETVMRALSAAYPDRIGPVEYRDGDWAFLLRGRWFYYAEGRILPEEHRSRAAEYRALSFNFNYHAELPSWESTAEDRASLTRSMEERRANRQPAPPRPQTGRAQYFYEALWNIRNREQASARQAQISFLGRSLTVHGDLSHIMRLINDIIMAESRTNPAVRQWVDSLGTVTGWNWRNMGTSANRSLHSYGIALDILPRNLNGLATYWAWESRHNPQWWNIPFTGRWHPPDEVIRTFESFGFFWGGKWINHFDTMHFEYRPEIFILSNIPMVNFRTELP